MFSWYVIELQYNANKVNKVWTSLHLQATKLKNGKK